MFEHADVPPPTPTPQVFEHANVPPQPPAQVFDHADVRSRDDYALNRVLRAKLREVKTQHSSLEHK